MATEYLWATRSEYARHIDNLRNVGSVLRDTIEQMGRLRDIHDFPPRADEGVFVEMVEDIENRLEQAINVGERGLSEFQEALTAADNR